MGTIEGDLEKDEANWTANALTVVARNVARLGKTSTSITASGQRGH